MTKRVEVKTEMTAEILYERYRKAKDSVERTHWHMLWQIKEGKSPQEIAEVLGYSAGWVRKIVRRWNTMGEAGIIDHRRDLPGAKPLLTAEQQRELAQALRASTRGWRVMEWSESSRLDAGETGTRGRPTTRVGLLPAIGL